MCRIVNFNQMKRILIALLTLFIAANLSAFDRGLGNPKSLYVEKGSKAVDFTVGYNSLNASDGMNLLGIVTEMDGKAALFNTGAFFSWFVKDNVSLGIRVGYNNLMFDGNSINIFKLVDLSNRHLRAETYEASFAARRYMPLFNSKFFALFCEGRLTGSLGYSKSYEETERGKEGSYTDIYSASLAMYVGASFFVTDNIAVEVSLPSLSCSMNWRNQIEKQEKKSSLNGLSFTNKANVLGISFGVVTYF